MHEATDTGEGFNITVGEFSGSLEALLTMVQKRKMHISDVSLSEVTDDYIEYIKTLGRVPQHQTAEFIVVAATLLLIKSKSLLPGLELSIEEQESIEELERRLELYKLYSGAREALEAHLANSASLLAPLKALKVVSVPAQLKEGSISIELVASTISELVDNLPIQDSKEQASLAESINIQDVMSDLLSKVERGMSASFRVVGGQSKDEVLVSFLALLELVKDGVMLASQTGEYGEILISRESSVI